MKNIIRFCFYLIFAITLMTTYIYASNTVISVGNIKGTVGETVTVPINISGNTGICSFGFAITYDKNYLTPLGSEKGIWDNDIIFNPNYSENQAFVTGAGISNKTGNGTFIYLKFKINGNIGTSGTEINVDVKQLKHLEGTTTSDVIYSSKSGIVSTDDLPKVKIGIENCQFDISDKIKVPVKITNNDNGVSTFGIVLNYESKYFTPTSVEKGIWNGDIIFNPNYGENQVFITGAGISNKIGDGDFLYINFDVKTPKNLFSYMNVDVKQLKNISGISTQDVIFEELNGKVDLFNKELLCCDINENNVIDSEDAQLILKYVLNKKDAKYNIGKRINGYLVGDVDGNNIINSVDSSLVLFMYEKNKKQ